MDMKTTKKSSVQSQAPDANPDPITGAPGAHPVGVGAGAAGGAATGGAIGAVVAGPIGAAVGGIAGAVAGGLAGKAAAEAVNPTREHEYWRNEFRKRPYVNQGSTYDEYGPAYQYGWESRAAQGKNASSFDDVEPELGSAWNKRRGKSTLTWEQAQAATRDAWKRVGKDDCGRCSE